MISYVKKLLKYQTIKKSGEYTRQIGIQSLFDIRSKKINKSNTLKINIGCGTDYREGFINIDGSNTLSKVDKIIDISTTSLLLYFNERSIDYILANDIIEHHYHWEAVRLLTDFYKLLKSDGICEIRVPDCNHIISSDKYLLEHKLVLLFGGQDISQGVDPDMDESRKSFPQYFCHKYGWSMQRMENDLRKIGFDKLAIKGEGSNFITIAYKN